MVEYDRHFRNVVETLQLFGEIPERRNFSCDPNLARNVDSSKPSAPFYQVHVRGLIFLNTVIFGL